MPQTAPADIAERLRASGRRATSQRLVTWEAVVAAMPHPTVHDVYERVQAELPSTAMRTVYDVLHTFEEMGLIQILAVPGGARLDVEPVDHGHGWCQVCGRVVNLAHGQGLVLDTDESGSFHCSLDHGGMMIGVCGACWARPERATGNAAEGGAAQPRSSDSS